MKEAEKQMNSLKLSFEKQLQNERTLKIQVCRLRAAQKPGVYSIFLLWKAAVVAEVCGFIYSLNSEQFHKD